MKMLSNSEFLELLRCPRCTGGLQQDAGGDLRCSACGRVFKNEEGIVRFLEEPRHSSGFYDTNRDCYDRIAPKFKSAWEETEEWQLEERRKFVRLVGSSTTVLDLGCGSGRDLMTLSRLGAAPCVGLDFSIGQLRLARERNVARLVNADFFGIPFRDSVFDGVWSCVTLLHVRKEDLAGVVQSVKRILKPGGIFFVSLQEGEGERVVERGIYDGVPMIIVYHMPEEVRALLNAQGFELIEEERHHVWKGIPDKERVFINFYARSRKTGAREK